MSEVYVLFRDDCEWRELAGIWPDTAEGLQQAVAACDSAQQRDRSYDWSVHRYPLGGDGDATFDDATTQVHPPRPTHFTHAIGIAKVSVASGGIVQVRLGS